MTTLSTEDVRDIYRARRFLELGGVDAAAHAPAEELARITDTVADLEKAVADHDITAFVQADFRAHAEVVALLGSRHLSAAHAQLMDKLRLVIIQVTETEQDIEDDLAKHQEFARLLVSGAITQARAQLAARLDAAERSVASGAAHSVS